MKYKINPSVLIWLLGLFATITYVIMSRNTSSHGEQTTKELETLEQMTQTLNEVNQTLSGLYKETRENEQVRLLLEENIKDYCRELGIECRASLEIPAGALGKAEHTVASTDMNGDPIATKYIPWGKPLPNIVWNTTAERFKNFVRYYANGFDESVFIEARNKYGVKEEVLACIAWSETTLGSENKSQSNIMNYWNNDRWDTRDFEHVLSNVMAAAHGISQGTYMHGNNILAEMSGWGRKELWLPSCSEATAPNKCYATSEENWHRNMSNCLTLIHWERQDWGHYTVKRDVLLAKTE